MEAQMAAKSFDMIVIGAGPGGYVAAIRGAQLGLRVAVVERAQLGGICLNWGCIPTKALLRSAEVFHLIHRAGEFGLSVKEVGFDLAAVVARSRAVAKQLSNGIGHLLKKNKVTVLAGVASLPRPGVVAVKTDTGVEEITSPNIGLATGARARQLPGLEADGDLVWSYKHALTPKRMPGKLLVIGSGAIGIEFASFYNTLGAETTVVEVLDRVLPVEDAEISAFARKQFVKQGMTILENTTVSKLDRSPGKVVAHLQDAKGTITAEFDTVISAVGILGNVEGLGLEALGVKIDRSHVVVDEFCRTGVAGLYAIGDIAGPPWLAHKASHEGVMVAELIAGQHPHPLKPGAIAGCTYCTPQVASVGLTEEEARAAGHQAKVGRFPCIGDGKAIALGEGEGLVKTVFDAKTGELLGAHMVGAEVTELIQGYVIGRTLETTEAELIETVFPHPTLSEMMHESVLDAFGRALHI
jgi:dihydrolipoamide dehydrogenase